MDDSSLLIPVIHHTYLFITFIHIFFSLFFAILIYLILINSLCRIGIFVGQRYTCPNYCNQFFLHLFFDGDHSYFKINIYLHFSLYLCASNSVNVMHKVFIFSLYITSQDKEGRVW